MAAVEAGATAVIQPGGSIRDAEVIAAADEAGLAMVFTGMRHFNAIGSISYDHPDPSIFLVLQSPSDTPLPLRSLITNCTSSPSD